MIVKTTTETISVIFFMAMQIGMLLGCLVLALLLREASENIGHSSAIFDKLAGRRFGK
jgi:hypothetical protein